MHRLVSNASSERRRMRHSILGDDQGATFRVRVRTARKPRSRTQRLLRATQDSARTRHKPPPAENATSRGNATASETRKGNDEQCTQRHGTPSTHNNEKKWNLHKTQEAATAADGANNSRSCRTTELRVGASSSFNRRSQACKIRRFCSSLR